MLKFLLIVFMATFSRLLLASEIAGYFREVESKLKLPENSLLAICIVESNLNPEALNKNDGGPGKHAFGICQVHAPTADMLGFKFKCSDRSKCLLMNRDININIAGLYLKKQLIRYKGNLRKAISAYNAGSWSTKNVTYVNKVMRAMK